MTAKAHRNQSSLRVAVVFKGVRTIKMSLLRIAVLGGGYLSPHRVTVSSTGAHSLGAVQLEQEGFPCAWGATGQGQQGHGAGRGPGGGLAKAS